jgi:phospholipid/cholesterol/gamma-HCH transport system substrate-binding protein
MAETESRHTSVRLAAALLASLIVAFAVLTYLSYTAAFASTDTVTVSAPRAGLVMDKGAKVKYRGIQIGKVEDISYSGDQARVTLAINSDEMHFIPSNAAVHIAGNTIFGAKSVEFIPPQTPSPTSLRPDAQIEASAVALEVNTLFQSLIDLLHKIDPVELNGTLSALSEGLRGHGDDLGALLSGLNTLTRQSNPKLPPLQEDFRKAAVVTNVYADAAPDLNTIFDNLPTISKTVVDEQKNLNDTLLATIGLSNNAYETLEPAEQNLIDAINRLRAPVKVAADYSPEFGCLFAGIERGIKEFGPVARCPQSGSVHVVELRLRRAVLHVSGGPAGRQCLRRSELPRAARHPDQADRRVVLPRAIPGHR